VEPSYICILKSEDLERLVRKNPDLGLGAPPRTLLYWMFASLVLWGVVLTGATALGLSVFSG